MTDLRKAAEMALEALELLDRNGGLGLDVHEYLRTKIQALRQALAQPEQEPVAGMFEDKLPDRNPPPWVKDYKPKREWVGLTDHDKQELDEKYGDDVLAHLDAIEAKLREKNGG